MYLYIFLFFTRLSTNSLACYKYTLFYLDDDDVTNYMTVGVGKFGVQEGRGNFLITFAHLFVRK